MQRSIRVKELRAIARIVAERVLAMRSRPAAAGSLVHLSRTLERRQ